MQQKLNTSVAAMVESAKAAIEEVSVEDAIKAMSEDGVLIVDIRDVRERQREGYSRQLSLPTWNGRILDRS